MNKNINKTDLIHIRIEPDVKAKAEEIFKQLGINTSYAISLFLNQVILKGGFPFDIVLPKNKYDSNNNDIIELEEVINKYTPALNLLDDYDHNKINKPLGSDTKYKIEYKEARDIIDSMKFNAESNLFGIEKEAGKLDGILKAIYQNVFENEVYETFEEKAAHILYFIVKDHPFIDGCKRIAATLFLQFLNKNNRLLKDGKLIISNNTLVSLTLLCAESKPEEKDVIINVIMHLLKGE